MIPTTTKKKTVTLLLLLFPGSHRKIYKKRTFKGLFLFLFFFLNPKYIKIILSHCIAFEFLIMNLKQKIIMPLIYGIGLSLGQSGATHFLVMIFFLFERI